jgi:hypothetical protein
MMALEVYFWRIHKASKKRAATTLYWWLALMLAVASEAFGAVVEFFWPFGANK